MSKYIPFKTDGGTIYIEAIDTVVSSSESDGGESLATGKQLNKATNTLKETLRPVSEIIQSTVQSVKETEISPNKLEIELGLKFSANGNVIVSKVSGEVALKIKATWEGN